MLDRLIDGQRRVLELAVAGAALPDVLASLAVAFEDVVGKRLRASILLLDPDGQRLRHGAAPSLPTDFAAAIDGMDVGPAVSSCGLAAFERRPVVVDDITAATGWQGYRELALTHGLRACWATPILASSGPVLGTFGLYSAEPHHPSHEEQDTVDLLSHTAALVIERERSLEALVTSHASHRCLVEVDDAVRPAAEAHVIARRAVGILGQALRANRCAYAEVGDDGGPLRVIGLYTDGVSGSAASPAIDLEAGAWRPIAEDALPIVVGDIERDTRIDAATREACRSLSVAAFACVPVLEDGRLVATLDVQAATPRRWSGHDVELVQQVASRCWESIERSRLTRTLQETIGREQRAREEADRERWRAESANRAKDEFLAMLGHELRNPLSPIRTALQLMKLRGDDDTQKERDVIERQVSHLTRLVDDLLDVSRIARGRVVLRLGRADMADVVCRGIELASPAIEERGHRLVVDLPDAPLLVTADSTRLEQVLANLLTNAAKYTDPGGVISVRLAEDGDDVVLAVRDTGRGIAADTLPCIFDLFVQERQGSDRPEGGLGLGLTIVRTFVERHGGRVDVASDGPGTGSEFTVRLPLRRGVDAVIDGPDVEGSVRQAPSGKRVLVVDDNEDGALMLAAVLETRGHAVRVAHDGPGALEVAEAFEPELALLDIGLPVMDGYELAMRLRERPGLEHLTLVAVTGYGQSGDRERSRAAGFDHHLVKPVDLEAIDAVLRG